jgi:predicted phosphoadenosine phosphosulfate sulfurtransferase
MAGGKRYLTTNVYEAAQERIRYIFDNFGIIVVSYSGGKDSTVTLELARQEAERRGRQIYALFIDPEAQYAETIRQIERAILHDPVIIPIWICVPLLWRNALSVFQPHWRTWEPEQRDHWVRPLPEYDCVISDPAALPFYDPNFGIDELVTEFPKLLCGPDDTYASLVGIRSDESFHRYTAIKDKRKKNYYTGPQGRKVKWSTIPDPKDERIVNFYPIYDWGVKDVWHFIGQARIPYNAVYDRMYLAGVPLPEQRICQPYGDEQRRGLDQWAKIEPETWAKVLDRVAGVNFGARYAKDKLLGYHRGMLPEGHTWKSYTFFLLSTLPQVVRERYMANFAIAIEWYMKKRFLTNFEDMVDDDLPIDNPSKFNIPSWRKMCLSILKNDFWGRTLDIGVTKYPLRDVYESITESGTVKVRVSVEPFYQLLREQYNAYLDNGINAVSFDFEHPTATGPARKMWKTIYRDI